MHATVFWRRCNLHGDRNPSNCESFIDPFVAVFLSQKELLVQNGGLNKNEYHPFIQGSKKQSLTFLNFHRLLQCVNRRQPSLQAWERHPDREWNTCSWLPRNMLQNWYWTLILYLMQSTVIIWMLILAFERSGYIVVQTWKTTTNSYTTPLQSARQQCDQWERDEVSCKKCS